MRIFLKIHSIKEDELDYISAICLDPSVGKKTREMMGDGMKNRLQWIKEMMPKGLEILVALDTPKDEIINYKWAGRMKHSELAIQGKVPMGLLEYLPIEYALEPVEGKKLLFINCMWILPPFWQCGIGKALLESFLDKITQYEGGCVITYDKDKWFGTSIDYMPSNFFKKFGFREVDREGSRYLLFYDFGSKSKPKFITLKEKIISEEDQNIVEIFYNSQCPWSMYMINEIKTEMKKYPQFQVNLINTDDRKIVEQYGISRGIRLNGKTIIKRMGIWEDIENDISKIEK